MQFKCMCSFKLNLKKKTKLIPLSNLCLPSSVHSWELQLDWHCLKLSFSSPGPGAPWDLPLPSATPVPLRVSTPGRSGASLSPSQVWGARATAGDHVGAGAPGCQRPPPVRWDPGGSWTLALLNWGWGDLDSVRTHDWLQKQGYRGCWGQLDRIVCKLKAHSVPSLEMWAMAKQRGGEWVKYQRYLSMPLQSVWGVGRPGPAISSLPQLDKPHSSSLGPEGKEQCTQMKEHAGNSPVNLSLWWHIVLTRRVCVLRSCYQTFLCADT